MTEMIIIKESKIMKKITLAAYKSYLSTKSKDLLFQELLLLYKKLPEVKEFYTLLFDDSSNVLEKYKNIMRKEFVESDTNKSPKARFSIARKCLNDFKKVCSDQLQILDLTLFYAECIADFNNNFGPSVEHFYTKAENLFEEVLKSAKSRGYLDHFKERAYHMAKNACEGWGFSDQLLFVYYRYYDEIECSI